MKKEKKRRRSRSSSRSRKVHKDVVSVRNVCESAEIKCDSEDFVVDAQVDKPAPTIVKSISKSDFFAQLRECESKKPMIGTIHAKGKEAQQAADNRNKGDWNCSKCGTTNMKYSTVCSKCGAMKRITEYR